MTGEKPKTSVHSPFFQGGLDFGRGNFLHDKADRGVLRPRTCQAGPESAQRSGRARRPGASTPRNCPGSAHEFLKTFLELAQNRPGMFLEDQAGRRVSRHAFAAALKESDTQTVFEVADLLRDAQAAKCQADRRRG